MYAVVRLRGRVNVPKNIKDTLKLLSLNRVNQCVLVPENPVYEGMIRKVKDWVAWGRVSEEMIEILLEKRGRIREDERLSDGWIRENTSYRSIRELAEAVSRGEVKLKELGVKPFRLHPPRKGLGKKGKKHTFSEGGALGKWEKIDELLWKMR
jgi:large subunit ribosomal protein L30